MSISRRVRKLEKQSKSDFVVAWHQYFDSDGKRITWSSTMDEDAVQAIEVNELRFERDDEEDFADFQRRATEKADELIGVTVWLHPAAPDL